MGLSLFLLFCIMFHELNTLVMNSESPTMCWCYIKKRNKSTSSWYHLTKSEPRFEFSPSCSLCLLASDCLLYGSESVPAGKLSCQSVPVLVVFSLHVCLSVCCVCVYQCKCVSVPNKAFHIY